MNRRQLITRASQPPSQTGTIAGLLGRIRGLEALAPRDISVTDGVTTVDPTDSIDVGSGLSLADLGAGVAGLSALLPVVPYALAVSPAASNPTAYTGGYEYDLDNTAAVLTSNVSLLSHSGIELEIAEDGSYMVVWSVELSDASPVWLHAAYTGTVPFGESISVVGSPGFAAGPAGTRRPGATSIDIITCLAGTTMFAKMVCPGNAGSAPPIDEAAVYIVRLEPRFP